MPNKYYQLAQDCMINMRDEAEAVQSYNEMILHIQQAGFPADVERELCDHIREIIDDELDHMRILRGIYTGDFEVPADEPPQGEPVVMDEGANDDNN